MYSVSEEHRVWTHAMQSPAGGRKRTSAHPWCFPSELIVTFEPGQGCSKRLEGPHSWGYQQFK